MKILTLLLLLWPGLTAMHAATITEDFNDWPHYVTPGVYTNDEWVISCFRVEGSGTFIPYLLSGQSAWLDRDSPQSTNQWLRTPQLTNGVGTVSFYVRNVGSGTTTFAVETATAMTGPWQAQTNFSHTSLSWSQYQAVLNLYQSLYLRIRRLNSSQAYMGLDAVVVPDAPADVTITPPINTPDTVYIDTPADIQCSVETRGGASIQAVTSVWRVAGGAWQTTAMTNTSGSAYETQNPIPGQSQAGAKVEYYIRVYFSGFNADSPRASAMNSYTIAVRAFDTDFENMSVTDDYETGMNQIADYTWQGVFSTNTGITDGLFTFSGEHTNTTIFTWGQTGRASPLPFAGTAVQDDGNITASGTYTGQFAFVFNEVNLNYTVRQGMYHDFTGWDSPTYATTSNNNWIAYNASIRNDGERRLRGNACYLSSNQLSFVQSPESPDGIGEISFWYRNYETNGIPTTDCLIQLSDSGGTNASEWTTIAAISNVAATSYSRFSTNINTRYARYVRILNQTEGARTALCIDEILVTYAGAGVIMTNETLNPTSPTTVEEVELSVEALSMAAASNIALTAHYRIGTTGLYTQVGMTNAGGNTYTATNRVPALTGDIDTAQFYFAATFEGFEDQFSTQPVLYPSEGDMHPLSYTAKAPVVFTNLVLTPLSPTILDERRAVLQIMPLPSVTNVAATLWYRGGPDGEYDSIDMVNTGNWTFVTQPDDIPRGATEMQFYIRTSYESVESAQTVFSYYPGNYDTDPFTYANADVDYFEVDFNDWPAYANPGTYSNAGWITSCFKVEGSGTFIPHLLTGET